MPIAYSPVPAPPQLHLRCRRCAQDLAVPTENPGRAFCSSECAAIHFEHHCVACGKPISPHTSKGRRCWRPACQKAFASRVLAVLPDGGGVMIADLPGRRCARARLQNLKQEF